MSVQKVSSTMLTSSGTCGAWDGSALTGVSTGAEAINALRTNLALNFFLDAVDSSRSIQHLSDGFVDQFEDQLGVDDPNSTNEVYDTSGDYYNGLVNKSISYNVQMVGMTDGTRIEVPHAYTGNADTDHCIFSLWVEFDSSKDDVYQALYGQANGYYGFVRLADNKIRFVGYTAAGQVIIQLVSATAYPSAAGPIHILISFNLASSQYYMYINDVDDLDPTNALHVTLTGNVDWTRGSHRIGNESFYGNMGQLYFHNKTFLDMSVTSNRRKFITATGTPVNLGSNGSTPTGSVPIRFHDGAFGSWAGNDGDGGTSSLTRGSITNQGNLVLTQLDNITLVSESTTALTSPDTAHVTLFKQDVSPYTTTINTDILSWASRSKQTITSDFATDNKLDATAHGLLDTGRVILTSSGADLPAGLDSNTVYYIVNKTANDFELSLTSGGAAVSITDNGTGTHSVHAVTPVTLVQENTYSTYDVLSGTADISGQPSGTDMKLVVQTKNTKNVKIHGQSLQWV